MNVKYKKFSVLPAVIIMIGIFCFSSQTAVVSSELSGGITERIFDFVVKVGNIDLSLPDRAFLSELMETIVRKAAHMTEYAVLAIAISFPLYVYGKRKVRLAVWSEILCVLYAFTDEFHQLFVLGRSGQVRDVFIDGCGALIGCMMFVLLCHFIINKNNHKNKTSEDKEDKDEKSKLGRVGDC